MRKALWALLAAGMTVVSTGIVSAQSTMAAPRVGKETRDVIDTISSKAVLILGRFSDDRKSILNALRNALRNKGFLPIVCDFERPIERDFTETIMTLAGMSCFVIADITNPRSAPLELQATVPDYMIPFVPILQDGETGFSMFSTSKPNMIGFFACSSTILLRI